MSRVAVLKGGRSLERQVSLKSGARVEDALERLGHEVVAIDVGHDLVTQSRECTPDAAFICLHGRDGEDDIREGVRRIGKVVREQVGLYGTLTGGGAERQAEPAPAPPDPGLADVLRLPDRPRRDRGRGAGGA